jgi:predicted nucleic acid-binding protein
MIVFDTSAFYALISKNDIFHEKAKITYIDIIRKEEILYTTNYILVETIALIHRRLGFDIVSKFFIPVINKFSIFWIDENWHKKGWEIFQEKKGEKFSFVDCTTLVIVKELDATLFTFDEQFKKENIKTIPL